MALYLNAKLKAFSDYHMSFWKMIAVLGPLIGAAFVAGSFVSDRVCSQKLPHVQSFISMVSDSCTVFFWDRSMRCQPRYKSFDGTLPLYSLSFWRRQIKMPAFR